MKVSTGITVFASLLLLAVAGCDSDDNNSTSTKALVWQECENDNTIECSTLEVPMVHSETDGKTITLALNRIPASGASPLGSLVFNPGGPGGSGLELIEEFQAEGLVPDSIRNAYHLISFDPRGVGKSTPIDCGDTLDLEVYPETLAALQEIEQATKSFAESCYEKIGDYLLHAGSRAVVRDMDLIRKALNESTLNFLGYSYGTRLAALYAQDFPARVGRFILDGSLPPTHDNITLFGASLAAMEANFVTLAQSCLQVSDCDPVQYKQKIESRFQTLIDTEAELELEILSTLVIATIESPELIPAIAEGLFNYSQNWNSSFLLQLADELGADDDEDDEGEGGDSETVLYAVLCADDARRPTAEEVESLRDNYNATSDLFAELQLGSALSCAGWPESIDPLPEISTREAPETLVIGGPTDSQTILPWSEQMAAAIGGRFLRSEHPGHTTVFSDKNDCTNSAAIEFLLNGILPDAVVCRPE